MGPRGQEDYRTSSSPVSDAGVAADAQEEGWSLVPTSSTKVLGGVSSWPFSIHGENAWWGLRVLCCSSLTVILIMSLVAVIFPVDYSAVFHDQTCGLEPSPIMNLKQSSTLDGLQRGAVAADHPVCSVIGKNILLRDGNAVDAAVATALCLGVANPASSGIGGGMFMVIHADRKHHEERWNSIEKPDFVDARNDSDMSMISEKMTEVIDAREVAPEGSYTNMYLDVEADLPKASEKGGLAVAVLGELRGLELAHARHGALDWSVVVEPAMRLARDGVKITPHLSIDIAKQKGKISKYGLTGLGKLLTKDGLGETMLKAGEILKNPVLAKTLEAVMKEGADAIYKGELAKSLSADVQGAGGILTEQDLNDYQATLRSPLISEASGFTIVGVPPPSSGGAAIIGILRFLSGFSAPLATFADTLSIHRLVEAMKHAFAIRMSLGDPDYFADIILDATNDLIGGNYMEELRLLYRDNETALQSVFGGPKWAQLEDSDGNTEGEDAHEGDRRRLLEQDERHLYREFGYLEDHGTTHLSVVDSQGNAVALTSSVNTYFGSGVVSESTGIVLNNQMDDFGTPGKPNYFGLMPSEKNFIKPRKKPLSSMSPTLFFKKNEEESSLGDLFMAIGASGGPKIITSVVQVFINHALLGMPLFESMAHPRIHDQLLYHEAAVTCFETDVLDGGQIIQVSNRTRTALASRGHKLLSVDYAGTVQAVAVDLETKTMSAVSDIRKGGTPAGY